MTTPTSKKDLARLNITAEQVKALREKRSCSLIEARNILIGQQLRIMLGYGHTTDVLKHIVNVLYPPPKD